MNQQAVFNFLNEAYEILQDEEYIPISSMIRKYKIGTYILPVLIEGGILKKIKRSHYRWSSIPPNLKMAEKVIQETRKKNKLMMRGYFQEPETDKRFDHFEDRKVFEIPDTFITEEPKGGQWIIPNVELEQKDEQFVDRDEPKPIDLEKSVFRKLKNIIKEKEEIIEILKNEKASLLESMDDNYEVLKKVKAGVKLKDRIIEQQEEKIELLEEKLKPKKYNDLTGWGDVVEEKKASKEYNFLWGMIKIKR